MTFDSTKEGQRYLLLRDAERRGIIKDLETQVRFELIPPQDIDGKHMRNCEYIADFCYMKDGRFIVEDVKGYQTEVFKIKKKLMMYIHGIYVREVKEASEGI